MRKLFSEKAGATFNDGLPTTTVCVRKDCVELVSKIDKGFYAITNLLSAGNGQMMIIANWGVSSTGSRTRTFSCLAARPPALRSISC